MVDMRRRLASPMAAPVCKGFRMIYMIRCGNMYFERWGSIAGNSVPVMTNDRSHAHRTDREAAAMIVTMLGYACWLAEIEPAEQSEHPAETG
jgi:hypothetical protein